MNLLDLTVIYFAVGAPFAVSYFLKHRQRGESFSRRLKVFFVFLGWLPFAGWLLLKNRRFRNLPIFDFFNAAFLKDSKDDLSKHQKQIENILLESDLNVSAFEYRETLERYAGLTLASASETNGVAESEIFRIAENDNVKLGSICLQRRNRNKLYRHQTEARTDFLRFVERLFERISDTRILQQSAIDFVKILNDETALESLEKMFARKMQTEKLPRVKHTEKDLWKPQEHKPLRAETISTRS